MNTYNCDAPNESFCIHMAGTCSKRHNYERATEKLYEVRGNNANGEWISTDTLYADSIREAEEKAARRHDCTDYMPDSFEAIEL